MFAVSEMMATVCGRYGVHVQPLSFAPLVELGPLDLPNNLPPSSKADPNKLSLITLDLSPNSRFLCAGDSGKNIFLFEFTPHVYWDHLTSWVMENRTAKIQFDRTGEHILITDRMGDVYLTNIALEFQEGDTGPGQVRISTPRKILEHDHHVLDVILSQENNKILTCSSDEKISVWTYPGYPTPTKLDDLEFKVDHKESLVNAALVNRDQNLISISADGTLKFFRIWLNLMDLPDDPNDPESYGLIDSSNPLGKSHKVLKSWNIFTVLEAHRGQINEVVRTASTTFEGRVYIAVQISGFKELPVFELRPLEVSLRLFGQARLTHEYIDMTWRGKFLFVFCPEEASMCKYAVSSNGGLMKQECTLKFNSTVKKDIAEYGKYNRPFFPAKKRVPPLVLETVEQTRDILLQTYGPLPTEEENDAKKAAGGSSFKENKEARRVQVAKSLLQRKMDNQKKREILTIPVPEIKIEQKQIEPKIDEQIDQQIEDEEGGEKEALTSVMSTCTGNAGGGGGRRVQFNETNQHDDIDDHHREDDYDHGAADYDYDDVQYDSDDDDGVEKFDGSSATQETTSIQTDGVALTDDDDGDIYADDVDADDEDTDLETKVQTAK